MRSIFTILSFFLFLHLNFAQNDWKEHLSHDRTAYAHHGHLIDAHGGIVLKMGNHTSPMNTTERIGLNTKSGVYWTATDINSTSDLKTYTYQSTRLGEEQYQVTLKSPIEGNFTENGVHSIIQTSPVNTSLRWIQNEDLTSLNIVDIIFPLSPFEGIHFTTDENKLYSLGFGHDVNWIEDFTGDLKLHVGLNSKAYKIHDGVFSSIENPNEGGVILEEYDKIDNNPFGNEFITINHLTINRYSYNDYTLTRSDDLLAAPIHHIFMEDGFYYLIETDQSYSIYFFSDDNSQSDLYYELPKTEEIKDFEITEFNLWQDEVIFLGLWHAPHIKENFSYVQRRDIYQDYEPRRKDLEFTNLEVEVFETGQDNQLEYKYTGTVTNLSEEAINYFTIYSDRLPLFNNAADQFIKHDFSQELEPGESIEISGEFIYSPLSSISFHIAGVDFGIDSYMDNNSFTVDFSPVATEDIASNNFTIAPNPSTNFITISRDLKDIESIVILDVAGRLVHSQKYTSNIINTSNLAPGQYWLKVNTSQNSVAQPFVKK